MAHQMAIDTDFESVEKWFYKLCLRFHHRTGYDLDEIISAAGEAYAKLYQKHDASRGKLTTWLGFKLPKELLEWERTNCRKKARMPNREDLDPDQFSTDDPTYFDSEDFIAPLSLDADVIARLVLESADDLKEVMNYDDLKEELRQWGWSLKRIKRTINELREALS